MLFSVGATQVTSALPVVTAAAITSMVKAGRDAVAVPSATLITMPVVAPRLLLAGTPESSPVFVLKVAQLGAFVIE